MKESNRSREPYEKFKKFLLDNGIKQKELADKLGKSQSFINKALNGREAEFDPIDFMIMRRVLKITINEYF